jgi:hypothetical protein
MNPLDSLVIGNFMDDFFTKIKGLSFHSTRIYKTDAGNKEIKDDEPLFVSSREIKKEMKSNFSESESSDEIP